jgi:hypothetical protein
MSAHNECGYVRASSSNGGSGTLSAQRITAARRRLCQLPGQCAQARARKARLICPDAASRQGLPYGGSTRFHGGSTRRHGHLGWFAGLRLRLRELPGGSGRLSPCLPDDGAPRCGCCSRLLACSSVPLTAIVVSAGQMRGLVMRPGRRRCCSPAGADPDGSCCVSLGW